MFDIPSHLLGDIEAYRIAAESGEQVAEQYSGPGPFLFG